MIRFKAYVALAIIAIVSYFAYLPGLSSGFTFDDYPNIVNNQTTKLHNLDLNSLKRSVFAGDAGPAGRPISMLSFALNYYAAGAMNPYAFKQVNLLIHLLNGVLLFLFVNQMLVVFNKAEVPENQLRSPLWISLTIAGAWLLHPLNLTSVLYVVQRMTSLSATFQLAALYAYCRGRSSQLNGESKFGISLIITTIYFIVLAFFTKENGAVSILYLGVIEAGLFRFTTERRQDKIFIKIFFFITLLLPLLGASLFLSLNFDDWLIAGFKGRDFTLDQRVLTESRVLWFYLYLIIVPNIRAMGLFHDDIALSTGLLSPETTAVAIFGLLMLTALAFRVRKSHPFLFVAFFGFIAGHSIESSIFPLELAHEHRNYLPQVFILLGLFVYLARSISNSTKFAAAYPIAISMFFAVLAFSTAARSLSWAKPIDLIVDEAINHPKSAITQFEAGSLFHRLMTATPERKDELYQKALHYFEKSLENDPKFMASLFGLLVLSDHAGHPIETKWVDSLAEGLRTNIISANTVNALRELSSCQRSGSCTISSEIVGRIFQSAIDNPRLGGRNRAIVLGTASDYLFDSVKNYEDALRLAYWAKESDPKEIQYRINLVNLLIQVGEIGAARDELKIAKEMDKLKLHQDETTRLEVLILRMDRHAI